MMNIDRPLDEMVKESRAAKRKETRDRRQKDRDGKKDPANGVAEKAAANSNGNTDGDTATKDPKGRSGGIRKKRRSRGGGGGDKARGDTEVVRKNERKGSANAQDKGKGQNGNESGARKPNKGAKVSVFNLDHGVTQSDIAELFETVGPLRSARLIVLADGRSSGSAEVIFEKMADALEAIRRYNNVPLDNRPLKITLSTESAPIRLSRGRRGGRRLTVDDADAPPSRRGDIVTGAKNTGNSNNNTRDRDFDNSPAKDNDRFADNDNGRFADNDRGYSRRNGRRSRNSRSYDRRGPSPDNQMYTD